MRVNDKKQMRIALLNKETVLYQNNCQSCEFKLTNIQECKGCEIFKQLRQIGDELLSLNSKETPVFELKVSKEEREMGLTVERYNELKEKGFTDRKIITEFGMNNASFYKWKSENGLIGNSKFSKNKTVENAEDTKPAQVEQKEGIRESRIKPVPPASIDDKLKFALKEIEELRTENDKLKEDIKEQIVEIESLEEKVQAYEEEIEKYKQKLSLHVERITKLGGLNRAIKERNEELLLKIAELESVSNNQAAPQTLQNLTRALLEFALDATS